MKLSAFKIMTIISKSMAKKGLSKEAVDNYQAKAMNDSYENLIIESTKIIKDIGLEASERDSLLKLLGNEGEK